eukprot:3439206-Alexandrium_andersonii.AAC.1
MALTNSLRISAAKLLAARSKQTAVSDLAVNSLKVPAGVVAVIQEYSSTLSKVAGLVAKEVGELEEADAAEWERQKLIHGHAKEFIDESVAELEGRMKSMLELGEKTLRQAMPDWKPETLAKPAPDTMVAQLVTSNVQQ